MRVVVTGATGNVGTSLMRLLSADPAPPQEPPMEPPGPAPPTPEPGQI